MRMRRCLLLALLSVTSLALLAQGASGGVAFSGDAGSAFEFLAGQAGIGFMGQMRFFEAMVAKQELTREDSGDVSSSVWAVWKGQNATGRVTAYASFPGPFNKKLNSFWVSFQPPSETALPTAMLAHLLAKGEKTVVSSGDTIDVKIPIEMLKSGCGQSYTLRIRMTTGALVRNTVEAYCPVQ